VNPNDGPRKGKHNDQWEKNWLRTTNKGEKVIKDARTTGNRRLSATLVRAEWRRVVAPKMMTMMIHSNSRSVSYGVPNFVTLAPFATQRADILQMHWHV
jgi:hypothetical protein